MALNIRVKDATGAQVREHIGECQECQTDPIVTLNRDMLRGSTDASSCRYYMAKVDERIEQLHNGSI